MNANEVNVLKAKLKAECQRRNHNGSLAQYASSEYDFTNVPVAGAAILEEHGKKTVDILLQVKDKNDLQFVTKDNTIPSGFGTDLLAYVDQLASEATEGSVSSCRGGCTGLCLGACSSGCSGCNSQCNGCTGCTGSRS